MAKAVGIDLGTTYTAVAVVDEYGKPVIIKNGDGGATTPSVVYVDHPHYIVGEVALQSTLTEPERVVQFVKRFVGVRDHRIYIEERAFSPEFISSVILRKVVSEASAALGEQVTQAVITVPAYFTEAQRQATLEAGQLAGLDVLRIINEPTAAALAYGVANSGQAISLAPGSAHNADGASNASAPAPNVPQSAPAMRQITYRGQTINVPSTPNAGAAREITYRGRKIVVGGAPGARAAGSPVSGGAPPVSSLPSLSPSAADSAPLRPRTVVVYDLGGGTFDVTVLAISATSLDVVAVGGEPQLGGKDWDDAIINFIEDEFESRYGAPLGEDASLEGELRLKAEAAKRQLSARPSVPITFKTRALRDGRETVIPVRIELTREDLERLTTDLLRRTQMALEGVMREANLNWSDVDEILCVGGSSKMPMVREMLTRLYGRAPLLHDPDECIAKGAAIQAALIRAEADGVHLPNAPRIGHVLPHTLGVATARQGGAVIEPIVPALTPLPCSHARGEFTTTMDDQTQVTVLIYEGEATDLDAYANGPIGEFHLDMTPPRPRGVPRIRVEFRCDENGRVIALARDQDTGKESRAFVHLGSARTDDEIRAESQWLSEALIS